MTGSLTNNERVTRAHKALTAYAKSKGEKYDDPCYITDLIADLFHLIACTTEDDSDDESKDTEAVIATHLRLAKLHFDAEHNNPEEEGA